MQYTKPKFRFQNIFETIFSNFKLIDLNQLSDTIKKFRESKGWSKAELGRRLGGISGQLIGQYERKDDPKTPGGEFFIEWKRAFGFDLMSETIVSHETQSSDNISEEQLKKQSLEKSIQNLTENELRTTAIIERLVAILEKQYGMGVPQLAPPGTEGTETNNPRKTKKPVE